MVSLYVKLNSVFFILIMTDKFETEGLEGGENIITENTNQCQKHKHPNQMMLVPRLLKTNEMPPGYQYDDLLRLVKVTSDLTVRVFVNKISSRRPKFYPDNKKPFPFHQKTETLKIVGTGIIWDLKKYSQKRKPGRGSARINGNHKQFVGEIRVATAAQVVYDSREAKATTCRLTIDSKGNCQPLDVVGFEVNSIDVKEDFCIFTCHTCNSDLIDHLKSLKREWVDLLKKVENRLGKKEDGDTFSFMVSHPHGSDKVVSFGHWVHKSVDPGFTERTKYTYTNASCPGSSGAFVYVLDKYEHVHCGVNRDGINFSSTSNYSSFRSPLKKIL